MTKSKSPRRMYMAITIDKYELPIAIFENIREVSAFANRSKSAIWAAIARKSIDRKKRCRYISINLEELEWV